MKFIPQRKCVVCRKIQPKAEMLRVSKLPDGTYQLDVNQTGDGRGAYLCNSKDCITKAIQKNSLHQSYKTKVPKECYRALEEFLEASV